MLAKLAVIPLTYSCDRSNSQIIVRFLIEEMLTGMIYPESAGKGQHPEEESVHIHTKSEMMAERVNSTIALCLIINYEITSSALFSIPEINCSLTLGQQRSMNIRRWRFDRLTIHEKNAK